MKIKSPALLAILFLSVIYRLFYFSVYLKFVPYAEAPFLDGIDYIQKAGLILSERSLFHFALVQKPPLYPLLLALYLNFFKNGLVPLMLAQLFMGIMTILLIYLLGKEIEGEKTGIIAAALWAFYFPPVFFEVKPMATTVVLFIALLFLLVAVKFKSYRGRLGAGILLGLLIIAKPNFMLFIPFFIVYCFVGKEPKGSFGIINPLLALVGVLLIVVPVSIRNYAVTGEFIPVSSNGGITFYHGNNEYSRGLASMGILSGNLTYMHAEARYIAEQAQKRELTVSEVDKYWYKKGFLFFKREGITGSLVHFVRKFLLFFDNYEYGNAYSFAVEKTFIPFPFLSVPTFLIIAFAGAGFFYLKNSDKWFLLVFSLTTVATALIFYSGTRYRLPAFPVFVIFAASAVGGMNVIWKERKYCCIVIALLFLLVSVYPKSWAIKSEESRDLFQLSSFFVANGEYGKLEKLLTMVMPDGSGRVEGRSCYLEGILLFVRNDYVKAELKFRESLGIFPYFYPAYVGLADLYGKEGNSGKEIAVLKEGYEKAPFCTNILRRLGKAFLERNCPDRAERYFSEASMIEPGSYLNRYYRGKSLFKMKKMNSAEKEFKRAVTVGAKKALPHFYLSMIYAIRGNLNAASVEYSLFLENNSVPENEKMLRQYLESKGVNFN